MRIAFDQYQRYKNTEIIVSSVRNNNEKFSILEVGANEHKNLKKFLPYDNVKFLDLNIPEELQEDPDFIKGDATSLKFNDGEYDIVVALDVLEHIDIEKRNKFFDEIYRVSKKMFIISAPFKSEQVSNAENTLNEYYKALYGEDYIWLKEHIQNGLPDLKEILDYLKSRGIENFTFSHGNIELWEKLTKIHFYVASNFKYYDYRFEIDKYYNTNLFISDNKQPCYRNYIVGFKDVSLKPFVKGSKSSFSQVSMEDINHIGQLEKNIDSVFLVETLKNIENQSNKLISIDSSIYNIKLFLENQIVNLKAELNQKDIEILNLSVLKKELEVNIENKRSLVEELKVVIDNLQNEKESLEITISEKDLEILVLNNKYSDTQKYLNTSLEHIEKLDGVVKDLGFELENSKNKITELEYRISLLTIKGRIKRLLKPLVYLKQKYNKYKEIDKYKEYSKTDISRVEYKLSTTPLISIVMPVYNVDPKWLDIAIKSIIDQSYINWELIIVDDCSKNKATVNYIKSISHPQIIVKIKDNNSGISDTSNIGVSLSSGDYIGLIDNDDELREHALIEVANVIDKHSPDVIYSDEDKVDEKGVRRLPLFKPDWSPDLLRSQMYICHFMVFKKELFEKISGFRTKFDGSQDYDLMLRFSEETKNIFHIPKVLYSWREICTSTACNPESKPYAHNAGLNALNEHLQRVFGKECAYATETKYTFVFDARYKISNEIKTSIIIPTKDKLDLLVPCVDSILQKTTFKNYEIIILNNNSIEEATLEWFDSISKKYENIRVIDAKYEFNWSKLNNHGIREATGDVFVFLNNDTEVINPEWLTRLTEKALRKDVGVVGGLLLYPDGTIQHAGVIIGFGGWADHLYKGVKPIHYGSPFISSIISRNVSAVTGACMAISKDRINEIGGFDEDFIICGSDIELCIRAIKFGYVNIYDSYVTLYHHESKTRTPYIPEIDFKLSYEMYTPYRKSGDPYYNVNLSLTSLVPKIKEEV